MVYGVFLDPEARKTFFETYKDIENLWEILSPSAELRDHITTYQHLAQLYAAVRNAYAEKCQSAFKFGSDAILMTDQLAESVFVESIQQHIFR